MGLWPSTQTPDRLAEGAREAALLPGLRSTNKPDSAVAKVWATTQGVPLAPYTPALSGPKGLSREYALVSFPGPMSKRRRIHGSTPGLAPQY